MPDREKVIKGIEHCLSRYIDGLCDDCPYMGELDKSYMIPMKCEEIIMRDALALLKEQPEIVRCKDCKYCSSEIRDGIKFAKCELKHNWMPQTNWFCADGE